jgi:transposase
MKSEQVAQYYVDLATEYEKKKYKELIVYFDGNPTHKAKMQNIFTENWKGQLKIIFRFIPPYSPKLNPVEYLIHWIRQKELHHQPVNRDLELIQQKIKKRLKKENFIPNSMIVNLLEYIEELIKIQTLSTERE